MEMNESNVIFNHLLSSYQFRDDAVNDLSQPRRQFSFENNNSNNDNCTGSTTISDGRIEERVQVDRRKLEQMIIAGRDINYHRRDHNNQFDSEDGFSTAAETFFTNIMRNTNTVITWPTKLKVGAKTKKDPFVKICGKLEDVERAKKFILSMLETRHNRVTIKIDVAFTDHSHIIGKQGRNTQLAMKQTACHIHFPDSNRNPDLEKSNMVSIAGPMQTVDQARRILRELAPLVITMETKNFYEDPLVLAEDPLIRELSSTANGISVLVRSNRNNGSPIFIIRGSVYQAPRIRTAALTLQQRFMNTTQLLCSTTLEILQQQHAFVLGPQNVNVQLISKRTGANIQYPRGDNNLNGPGAATTFLIQGTIDAVLNARKHLVGCLPMSFVFESPNEISNANELEKQYGLSIGLRPKRNGDARNIVVKGQERQATAMYEVRRHFTNTDTDEPRIIAADFEFMRDFDVSMLLRSSPSRERDSTSTPITPLPTLPHQQQSLINTPMISPLPSPAVFGFSPFYSTPSPFSPLSTASISSPPLPLDQSNIYFNTRYSSNEPFNMIASIPSTILFDDSNNVSNRSSPNDTQSFSLLNSSSSTTSGATLVLSSSNSNTNLNSNDPRPEEAPLACGLLKAAKKIQENCNNWKAPGAERGSSNADYDQQKLMASKAMQEKALGLRVPNQQWSGLGFSRSMPAPILRQLKAAAAVQNEKSIDFGESSGSSTSSGALHAVDEDEEDKIGPWPLETRQVAKETFNMTTYFDSIHLPRPNNNNISTIDMDDIATVLSQLHLTKYVDTFREQEVDMNAFLTMTDADLKELGVNTFGARRKLLVAISEIKEYRRHFR